MNGAARNSHDALFETTTSFWNSLRSSQYGCQDRRAAPVLQSRLHPADQPDQTRGEQERQRRLRHFEHVPDHLHPLATASRTSSASVM